jgi:hypothetical protein
MWTVLPEKEYLFSKVLSKYLIGVYAELYNSVSVSFEVTCRSAGCTISSIALEEAIMVCLALAIANAC